MRELASSRMNNPREQDKSYNVIYDLTWKVKFQFCHFHNILLATYQPTKGCEYQEVRII